MSTSSFHKKIYHFHIRLFHQIWAEGIVLQSCGIYVSMMARKDKRGFIISIYFHFCLSQSHSPPSLSVSLFLGSLYFLSLVFPSPLISKIRSNIDVRFGSGFPDIGRESLTRASKWMGGIEHH